MDGYDDANDMMNPHNGLPMGGMDGFDEDEIEYPDLDVDEEADVSTAKDGGVTKKVLAKGIGDERPEKGDEVVVHYTGTLLDGTKFDSSVDRGDPFKFRLGLGQVIKGRDQGVASMKKGEKAILTCKPYYAYGERGSPPTIPANSTLKFEVELFSWKSDKDLYGDGGCVRAKVLKKSGAFGFPMDKHEVTVKYSACAPDTDVAGAGDEIVPATEVTFAVGADEAPFKGLEKAVTKMKEGETCLFRMKNVPGGYQYCEGLNAQAADVTVTLEVHQPVDSICNNEGTKKTTVDGEGYDHPNDGSKCVVSYTITPADGGAAIETKEDFEFELGLEILSEGLEEVVLKMKKSETAECVIPSDWNTYGQKVKAVVTLKDFEKEKESWSMDTAEKISAAEKVKNVGNDAYKGGKLGLAAKKYLKALQYIEYDQNFADEEKAQTKKIKLSLYLNGAAVAIKQKDWSKAVNDSTKALNSERGNEKALYRRAQASCELEEYDEAERDVKELLEKDENHKEAKALLAKVKRCKVVQAKKDAKVFGGMFSKLGGLYKDEPKVDVKAEGGELKEPIDIGGGFSMEEVKDDGEPNAALDNV